jgi:hypothetical protein
MRRLVDCKPVMQAAKLFAVWFRSNLCPKSPRCTFKSPAPSSHLHLQVTCRDKMLDWPLLSTHWAWTCDQDCDDKKLEPTEVCLISPILQLPPYPKPCICGACLSMNPVWSAYTKVKNRLGFQQLVRFWDSIIGLSSLRNAGKLAPVYLACGIALLTKLHVTQTQLLKSDRTAGRRCMKTLPEHACSTFPELPASNLTSGQ